MIAPSSPATSAATTPTIGGEALGRTVETPDGVIAIEVWKYVLDADGKETGYIRRIAGRPVVEVARDLAQALEATRGYYDDDSQDESSMIDEYASVGHEYKYLEARQGDTPVDWPPCGSVECSAVRGGSEGHYVHVDLVVSPSAYGGKGRHSQHIRILTVKTFRGFAHAWKIAAKATELLGGGD